MMRYLILAGLCLALAACGNKQGLHPAPGASLPPKPALAPTAPTANDLLRQPSSERPTRSDELLTRSQPRPDDPFNQPPK